MKFGIFVPNTNNGFIISEAAPQYKPSFDLSLEIVEKAERNGLEFALSLVKLRGYGGRTEMWDYALESLTLTAALAARTERIRLFGSVGVLTLHPAIAARMAATIQDVAQGRFGLNIVSGWNRSEYAQAGLWPGDQWYGERYDYSSEYVQVLKELWTDGVSDFKGKYFQLDDCRLEPRPKHHVEVVCAGSSDRGVEFTAEYGDYNFIMAGGGVEGMTAANQKLLAAGDKAGREVRSIASIIIILGDTDADAERKVQSYFDGADLEALKYVSGQAELDVAGATAQKINQLRGGTFMATEVIAGSPDTVAEKLDAYSEVEGLEGMMLCFDDYREEIDRFGQEVMPKLGAASTVV